MIERYTLRRNEAWWVASSHEAEPEMGPYSTKKEAAETIRSLRDFDKYENEPGFMTSNKPTPNSGGIFD